MNDNETLTKLVEQAVKGDKRALPRLFGNRDDLFINDWQAREVGSCHKDGAIVELVIRFRCPEFLKVCTSYFSLSDLLFNHPFMQAACGEGVINGHERKNIIMISMAESVSETIYHMIEMAKLLTDPERLKYVRENILTEVTK